MRPRNTFIASSFSLAIFAMLVCNASLFAAKPPRPTPTPPPPPSPTVELYVAPGTPDATCPGETEVTGIYQDGGGIYLPNQGVGFNSGGDLNIRPLCSENREINALLPADALAELTGPMGTCLEAGSVLLKIPDLLNAQDGTVVGESSPPAGYIDSVHYYFLVDTNGNGKFKLAPDHDDSYNLVWQSGIWLTLTEYVDRWVYELTTDLTSPNADLFLGGDNSQSLGTFCIPLRLIVTRMK
jgi:hypothetical protein